MDTAVKLLSACLLLLAGTAYGWQTCFVKHRGSRRSTIPLSVRLLGGGQSREASADTAYLDPRSGATYPLSTPRWCGDGQAPLLITPLPGMARGDIRSEVRSLWRYGAALPFVPENIITMGEGCTPLITREIAGCSALLKCEWFMPTGSFKDRGATVMLSLLKAQGVTHVLEDSSGNGGAAISAYAAAGGMQAKILVPASTSPAKTVAARAAGAEIELVPGSRQVPHVHPTPTHSSSSRCVTRMDTQPPLHHSTLDAALVY